MECIRDSLWERMSRFEECVRVGEFAILWTLVLQFSVDTMLHLEALRICEFCLEHVSQIRGQCWEEGQGACAVVGRDLDC